MLRKDDMIGEMACLRKLPRAADCQAAGDVYCLEMLPHVFQIIGDNPAQRSWRKHKSEFLRANPAAEFPESRPPDTAIQLLHRQRAKEEVPRWGLFEGVSADALDPILQRADLVDYEPNDVICAQGEPPAEFYLIRRGFVKVSQRSEAGTTSWSSTTCRAAATSARSRCSAT
jgi:CRP-like cAMP-binding protein